MSDLRTTGGYRKFVCEPSHLSSLHTDSTRDWFTEESLDSVELWVQKKFDQQGIGQVRGETTLTCLPGSSSTNV